MANLALTAAWSVEPGVAATVVVVVVFPLRNQVAAVAPPLAASGKS